MKVRKHIRIDEHTNEIIQKLSSSKNNYSEVIDNLVANVGVPLNLENKMKEIENLILNNKNLMLKTNILLEQLYADLQIENVQDPKKSKALQKFIANNRYYN